MPSRTLAWLRVLFCSFKQRREVPPMFDRIGSQYFVGVLFRKHPQSTGDLTKTKEFFFSNSYKMTKLHGKSFKEWTLRKLINHARRHKVKYSCLRKAQLFKKLCDLEKARASRKRRTSPKRKRSSRKRRASPKRKRSSRKRRRA